MSTPNSIGDSENSPIITRNEENNNHNLQSFSSLSRDSQNVRYNVIADGIAPTSNVERGHFAVLIIQTIMQLPPGVAALIMVPIVDKNCDQAPLDMWAFTYGLVMLLSLVVAWIRYREPPESNSSAARWAESVRKPLDNFALIWLIMGQIWVQSAPECATSAPSLYSLCFWLVLLGFCYLLLPCIIIILMLPFLCFCLPCVIRILARFSGTELGNKHGATKEMIDQLPKKKFHPDLFSDEPDPQCSICLCSYEQDQEVRILPCDERHHFHQDCIDEWLLVNATCPICRAKVVGDAEDDHAAEETANMV